MGVSWFRKFLYPKQLLLSKITEERAYFALTLITGICAGIVAVTIQEITHQIAHWLGTWDSFTWKSLIGGGVLLFISGYLTTRHFPSTSGSGIPGVRIALAVYHGRIFVKDTLAKFLTSILSLSSGLSLGREGPTVAITAGIGSALGRMASLPKRRVKALVAIGSAGGIAAAFHTPMSAVVFTLEEIVGDLNAKLLGSIIISSVIASFVAFILTGESAAFPELRYGLKDHYELIIYLIIGLCAAVIGPLWVATVLKFRETNLRVFRGHRLTIIMLTFFVMAGISLYYPRVLGSGHDIVQDTLLSLITDWKVLLILFILKFIATALSYASGASGGLFMPTLLMGALLGGSIGSLFQSFSPDTTSHIGAYALVGMGAYFASVIRAPFTSILIVFELTRNYSIIIPLMIANAASYMLASQLSKGSIYERISEQDGIHLPGHEDNEILESLHVEDAMIMEVVSLNTTLTISDASKRIKEHPFSGFPILRNGLLEGMVSTNDIEAISARGEGDRFTIQDIMEKKIISIYPDQSLLVALHKLKKYSVSRLPVVSRLNDKYVIGIITAENIVSKFGYHVTADEEE